VSPECKVCLTRMPKSINACFSRFSHIGGILCIVGGMIVYMTQNVAFKWFSTEYPLYEILLIRGVVAVIFILIILVPLEGGFTAIRTDRLNIHLFRGFGMVIANLAFYMGLAGMPLADGTAIFFIQPVLITIFSTLFLKERVGIWRWIAVFSGLLGVLIIMRPGSGLFQLSSTLPLIAAIAYALVQVNTRAVGKTEKASTMAFYNQATFVVLSGGIGLGIGDGRYANGGDPSYDFLFRAWVAIPAGDLLLMFGLGFLLSIGIYLIFQGYRISEASLVAPFEYIAVPLSIVCGIFVFKDHLDPRVWLGIGLIVVAGIYTVYRQAMHGRRVYLSETRDLSK